MLKQIPAAFLFLCICAISFGKGTKHSHSKNGAAAAYHSPYDDSTLLARSGAILMPYNRYIDPAGAVVRYGNPDLENHALDCILLPDGRTLAVEDRYGVAFIDIRTHALISHLDYDKKLCKSCKSTYSGIKTLRDQAVTHLYWSMVNTDDNASYVVDAVWDGSRARIADTISFAAFEPAPMALPNDIAIHLETGQYYMYVVLNGNNQLVKLRMRDKKIIWTVPVGVAPFGIVLCGDKAYVTNWAGPYASDPGRETAGIPYGRAYTDSRTGATLAGTVSVVDIMGGRTIREITVGLHPNAIIASPDAKSVYVANGNSDYISVISTQTDAVTNTVSVRLNEPDNPFIGDAPNALAIDQTGSTLYVANGMDNALAVVKLSGSVPELTGFIPTEAYPSGLAIDHGSIYVCNLEGEGPRLMQKGAYTAHHEGATVSIIPIPGSDDLRPLTHRVEEANMQFRTKITQLLPRRSATPKPVPDRIGEPSVIRHILYIIKENRTYDQVLGDMKEGDGMASLCIFGDSSTPNQHRIARTWQLLDNYYASGKSSAEGHQWADAAMASDYVEKAVRGWFRSYPHVQEDALVYNKEGFIWNDALDHGRSVIVYGEACMPEWDGPHNWTDIYTDYKKGKPFKFRNETTISRVRPVMSQTYPCGDVIEISDQMRADAFIKDLKTIESQPGDLWPDLMVMALPNDHTAGTSQTHPTPRAMVADNDLALGRIIDAVTHSRFWDSTAIFVSEDDSQDGWDHVSAYRTTGFVVSPYSRLNKTIHTNYNQTCMLRTIEQILGLPPMNTVDATALPMFDCFEGAFDNTPYTYTPNIIPLDEMNKAEGKLHGEELNFEKQSSGPQYAHVDGGNDDLMNRILWFYAYGKKPYPRSMTLPKKDRDDD